ncbi:helix-turn-helix domain-containing protein [Jiulongibacter sediminis]|uniref:Helix-turn-helix domain-containing protein n=1 Tax=Jiulongibacter sediminis TaxID=1605367 RepID=A0A0N8H9A1_9BACT|nr:hypothetical protein AFM12_18780 [Jiulongibacter sediminis]TBX21701.1 hypothetical protein TK44_18785 [Jiulongibacter sediminis]
MITHDKQSHPLFTLSIGQFESLMKDLIDESASRSKKFDSDPKNEEAEYMNGRKAAVYLNISVPTLTKLSREKKIPVYRISESRVLYAKSDLDAFVRSSKEL